MLRRVDVSHVPADEGELLFMCPWICGTTFFPGVLALESRDDMVRSSSAVPPSGMLTMTRLQWYHRGDRWPNGEIRLGGQAMKRQVLSMRRTKGSSNRKSTRGRSPRRDSTSLTRSRGSTLVSTGVPTEGEARVVSALVSAKGVLVAPHVVTSRGLRPVGGPLHTVVALVTNSDAWLPTRTGVPDACVALPVEGAHRERLFSKASRVPGSERVGQPHAVARRVPATNARFDVSSSRQGLPGSSSTRETLSSHRGAPILCTCECCRSQQGNPS
jgi:hypothetical protein